MNINNCPTVYDEKIPESVKVPTEAYLYFPSGMDLKIGEGKKGIRRIFEGQVIFDTFELEMIQILKHMIQKQTENIIDLSRFICFLVKNSKNIFLVGKNQNCFDFCKPIILNLIIQ